MSVIGVVVVRPLSTLEVSSVVLLAAVAVRPGTVHDGAFAGPALLTDCAVAAVLGWHKVPFLLIVGRPSP